MPESLYYLSGDNYRKWLDRFAEDREVYTLRQVEDDWRYYRRLPGADEELDPSGYRAVESLKNFFFPPRKTVASFPRSTATPPEEKERVIVGPKACDLGALPILDYIFLEGDFIDPFYRKARERTLLVTQDCTGFKDVCFCPIVGGKPHPTGGFDINLTPLEKGWLVEAAGDKGQAVIEENNDLFQPATAEQAQARDRLRSRVEEGLKKQLEDQGQIKEAPTAAETEASVGAEVWEEEAVPCVECGACNLVCPTCHCFILEEVAVGDGSVRLRNWDACQYPGFARVAGGANPRPRRSERLENRFLKKFQFFPEAIEDIACTGCGRCFEACMGEIDIRRILKKIKGS